jgi:hypothetical protein
MTAAGCVLCLGLTDARGRDRGGRRGRFELRVQGYCRGLREENRELGEAVVGLFGECLCPAFKRRALQLLFSADIGYRQKKEWSPKRSYPRGWHRGA